jgi:RND family efflux transporter MFP subunit
MRLNLLRHARAVSKVHAGALLLGGNLALAACREKPPAFPTPEVTVAAPIQREVADWDESTGHFESVNAVDVRPRVSGYVQRVAFTEGSMVHEGDILFVIDPRPYEADVAKADADLERARTRKELADMELQRAQRLVSAQAISREELDARTSGRAEGDAAIRAADAALRTARLNLEWTVVRAPISGRVGRAEITTGNLVQAGPGAPTLTTIVSLDPIYVYFDTDEQAYLKYMATSHPKGRPVYVGLANEEGFPHEGTLNFVDNSVDRSTGTIHVRALLPNHEHLFTPGLFARVRLVGGQRHPTTLIQDQSIGTDQDRKFVFVLKDDNTVEYRPVTIGRIVDGLRAVQSGLEAGDRVVINGLMRVRPGMKVTAKSAPMVAAATPASERVAR